MFLVLISLLSASAIAEAEMATSNIKSTLCTDAFFKSQASSSCELMQAKIKHEEPIEYCELMTACQYRIATESRTNYSIKRLPIEFIPLVKNRLGVLTISFD